MPPVTTNDAFPLFAQLPNDQAAVEAAAQAAVALQDRLKHVVPHRLGVSDYMRVYLEHQLENIPGTVQSLSLVLAWALSGIDRPIGQATVLDYGGGTGLLALLARLAGARSVVYNDIFAGSSTDAEIIARTVGMPADAYIVGDLSDVIVGCRKSGFEVQSVVSNNVIEHVYKPEEALERVRGLATGPLVAVWATDATPWNPLTRWRRTRMQHRIENLPRPDFIGRKPIDSLRSYREMRATLIREEFPHLGEPQVERLATATRGLRREDIIEAVASFSRAGIEPAPLGHPTNTCDPITGNWAEHMLNWNAIEANLRAKGCATRIVGGLHGRPRTGWKRAIALLLNASHRVLGPKYGLVVAPWHLLWTRWPME